MPSAIVRSHRLLGLGVLAVALAGCARAPEVAPLEAARAALEAGRPAEAVALLKPHVVEQVEDGIARALLAEALLDMGNLTEAKLQLAEADRLRAPRSQLRVSECRIATQTNELAEALRRCSTVVAESPAEKAALHLHAGHAQREAGHPQAALEHYARALEQIPRWEPALRGKALALALAGDDAAADQAVEALVGNSRDQAGAWHLRGEIEFLRGRYPTATRAFTTAAELAAKSGQADLQQRAREHQVQSLLMAQDNEAAFMAAKALQADFPRALVPLFQEAQALGAQGQLVEARGRLDEFLRTQSENLHAKLLMGILLLGLGQPGQAEMFLHNVEIKLPGNGLVQATAAAVARHPGQPEKAFAEVRPWVFGNRQDARWLAWGGLLLPRAALVANEGIIDPLKAEVAQRLRVGGPESALQYLEAELKRGATAGKLAQYALLLQHGRPQEAIAALKRALELDPENGDALNAYGEVLITAGRAQEAIPFLERAAKLAPDDPRLHYRLALAYSSTSNRSGARDALGEALRSGQLFDERRAAETLAVEMGLQ